MGNCTSKAKVNKSKMYSSSQDSHHLPLPSFSGIFSVPHQGRFISQNDLLGPSTLWYETLRHLKDSCGGVQSVYHPNAACREGNTKDHISDDIHLSEVGLEQFHAPPKEPAVETCSPLWHTPLDKALGSPKASGTIRITCISDTHGFHERLTELIPRDTDVLVHAGDFTNVGKKEQIEQFARWLRVDMSHIRHKVVIAGNHELSMDQEKYLMESKYLSYRMPHPQSIPETAENLQWLAKNPQYTHRCVIHPSEANAASETEPTYYYDPEVTLRRSCIYLKHEGVSISSDGTVVRLHRNWSEERKAFRYEAVPETHNENRRPSRRQVEETPASPNFFRNLVIFGSPYQPEFFDWGFNLSRGRPSDEGKEFSTPSSNERFETCRSAWRTMDTECDILVTHGPPLGHGDWVPSKQGKIIENEQQTCKQKLLQRFGCADLLDWCTAFKPRLHIFGHFHHGYGVTVASGNTPEIVSDIGKNKTLFVNASNCNERYDRHNLRGPIVIDMPIACLRNSSN